MPLRTFITKQITLDCGHDLAGFVPEGHKCARPHGHTYTVTVVASMLTAEVDTFVADFGVIKQLIVDLYDHRNLNDVLPFKARQVPTTVEKIADVMWELMDTTLRETAGHEHDSRRVEYVTVREGNGGEATVRRCDS